MKIPRRHQIFALPVVISDKDAERLSSHLSGWNHLHELLILGVNERDLERLVILELGGKRRLGLISRLLSRLLTMQRNRIWEKIVRP